MSGGSFTRFVVSDPARARALPLFVLLLVALGQASSPTVARAANWIGVFGDAAATQCAISAPLYTATQLHVQALVHEPDGLASAEFRIQHDLLINQEVIASVSPNPLATAVSGDPLGAGAAISFGSCQPGPIVPLFVVTLVPVMPVEGRVLRIDAHTNPSNENFDCPTISVFDAPTFTRLCVADVVSGLNGAGVNPDCWVASKSQPADRPGISACTVAIEEANWSAMKQLFR